MNIHNNLMKGLQEKHEVLKKLIGDKNVVYLDIPIHRNIGDLLIMQGTYEFLKKNNIKVEASFTAYNIDYKSINLDTVIIMHGGGNFGDLYELHQNLREKIINNFPHNKIIVMPQTIWYESEKELSKTIKLYQNHKDVHLCVRDQNSLDIGSKISKNIYLLPDMAHQLYSLKCNNNFEPNSTLYLKRTDIEANNLNLDIKSETNTDWKNLVKGYMKPIQLIRQLQSLTNKNGLRWVNNKVLIPLWLLLARRMTNKAINLFCNHKNIVTDRLHGHILSCLLNKPHDLLDNSYGKNSTYYKLWTQESSLCNLREK